VLGSLLKLRCIFVSQQFKPSATGNRSRLVYMLIVLVWLAFLSHQGGLSCEKEGASLTGKLEELC